MMSPALEGSSSVFITAPSSLRLCASKEAQWGRIDGLSRAGRGIWEYLQTTKVTSGSGKYDAKNRCPLIPVTRVTGTSVNQNVWLSTYLTVCIQPGRYCRTAIHLSAAAPAPCLLQCIRSSHSDCRGEGDACIKQHGEGMKVDDPRWVRRWFCVRC